MVARTALSALLLAAVSLSPPPAAAHRLAPSLLELREREDASAPAGLWVDVLWKTPIEVAGRGQPTPELPPHCRPVGEASAERAASAATLRLRVDCGERGLRGARVGVAGLAGSGAHALLRVELADGRRVERLLHSTAPWLTLPERARGSDLLADYARLGLRHIGSGPDHLLFLLGLVMLIAGRRQLLLAITSFTLGHSATLALAVLGFVRLPPAAVEIAIAASIFALALELARGGEAPAGPLRRHPGPMTFAFGLLHGLGFAGALSALGLPAAAIPLALFGFNLGIEIGQLACVLLALAAQRLLRAVAPRPVWLAQLPVYAIGTLAAYWCLERIAGVLG